MPRISASLCSRLRAVTRALALLTCIAALAVGAFAPAQSSSDQKMSTKSTTKKHARTPLSSRPIVLVFPVTGTGDLADSLSDLATQVFQSRLQASGAYRTVYFLASLPSVQRAILEGSITQSDARPPFDNNTKVVHLARINDYPMLIVGSIDQYKYDPETKKLSIILSGRLIDVSGQRPHVLRSASIPASVTASGTEEDAATQLTRDTAEKLMTELLRPVASSSSAMPAK